MPELPEVEVLVRHLRPQLLGRRIRGLTVRRRLVLDPTTPAALARGVVGATFGEVSRRGKFLLFTLASPRRATPVLLVGHLGMTGRMYLAAPAAPLAKHAAVVLDLGGDHFIFEDTRYFGRLTLDTASLERLGPEPLDAAFSVEEFGVALARSAQAIKVKLLDQSLVAGVGNIYASEALFRAGISPRLAARRLQARQVARLWSAIRDVLAEAIAGGSTLPLDWSGRQGRDGLFYFGRAEGAGDFYEERLQVYDRAGRECRRCGAKIVRIVQAARSTFFCRQCQPARDRHSA
ncbi:formamidopyrimidine-DNA glycosylase [Verrucomicrobiota bacterium]|nr:formamidopyrimidine-DNA glycosylase [Verrucomicrobiota bacterium]